MEVQQQYDPLKVAIIGLRILIGIATVFIGTYAIKTLFPEISGVIATLIVAAALCVLRSIYYKRKPLCLDGYFMRVANIGNRRVMLPQCLRRDALPKYDNATCRN